MSIESFLTWFLVAVTLLAMVLFSTTIPNIFKEDDGTKGPPERWLGAIFALPLVLSLSMSTLITIISDLKVSDKSLLVFSW